MALINQNSIIGVTSITSPSASNVLTFHTNDTTERLRVSTSGVSFSGTNASLDTSGNLTIAGVLTYEDVTSVDSVGLSTFQNGIHVTGGSVGIGTAVPATKLNVIGDTRVEGYSNAKIQIKRTGNTVANGSIEFLGSDDSFGWGLIANYDAGGSNFNIKEGSNSRLYIKSGNVGIGTDNPQGVLDVRGDSIRHQGLNPYITFHQSDGTNSGYLQSRSTELRLNSVGSIPLTLGTDDTERLRINSSGKVGIGTNDPKQKLSVLGRTSFDIRGDYYGAWIDGDTDGTSSFNVGAWYNIGGRLRDDGNHVAVETMTTSHHLQLQPNGGNVGIGLSYPDAKLHIYQSDSTNYSTTSDQRSEAEIRITNPLETSGTFSSINFYNGAGTGGDISLNAVKDGNYASHFTIKQRAGGGSTDWRERLRITSSGDVGIGTDLPREKVDLRGGSFCMTGDGSNFRPHIVVRPSSGTTTIRYFEYYFDTVKSTNSPSAQDRYILDITNIGQFFQASFEVVYGTRLQSVSDATTSTCTKTFGVNRFNNGNVAVTDENNISVDSNSNTHADVTMDALSSTAVRLKVAYSSTVNGSSFCSGVVRGWGVYDVFREPGSGGANQLTFYSGV